MSQSFTISNTVTFTLTHAKYLASKVATDLKRMQRFYGSPTDYHIAELEEELGALLKNGYIDSITYGFKQNDKWIAPTLKYVARDLVGANALDDDPGRVLPGCDVSGAVFHSYLMRSEKWRNLTSAEQAAFNASINMERTGAPYPGISGYFSSDLSYSSGGRGLNRSTLKSY